MGLADRDYARGGPTGGAWGSIRRGGWRFWSVNTCLIIINVAVFLIGNVVLANKTDLFSAGVLQLPGASSEQVRDGVVNRNVTAMLPGGYIGNPVQDRRTGEVVGYRRYREFPVVQGYGHLSTGKGVEIQFWRFLTFQFLHANQWHLLLNMLGLWFVGNLVEEYLGRKRYLAFYLISGIAGAVCYLLLNAVGYGISQMGASPDRVPGVLFNDVYTPLVGASAGVFGVLMAAAYIAPTSTVYVMYVLPLQMRTAVYLFTGVALLNLIMGGSNAGGDAAHIGGAIAGFYFIRRTYLLRDFFQLVGGPARAVSRRASRGGAAAGRGATAQREAEVDRILVKVRDEGTASLTETERRTLREASRTGGAG